MIALPGGGVGALLYTGDTRFVGAVRLAFDGTGQIRVSVAGSIIAVEARDARTLAPRPVPPNMRARAESLDGLRFGLSIDVQSAVDVTGGGVVSSEVIFPSMGGSDLPVWLDASGLAVPAPQPEVVERIDQTIPRSTRIYRETIPPRAPDLVVRWRATPLVMSIVALTNVTAGVLRAG